MFVYLNQTTNSFQTPRAFRGVFFHLSLYICTLKTHTMDFSTYDGLFDTILKASQPTAPYDKPAYQDYTKLNASRQSRWMKKGELLPQAVDAVRSIKEEQHWILITEHWCGDAAHNVPFIARLAAENPLIQLEIQLRDQPPHLIEDYLTNGGKSIPKLIVRDKQGRDLFTWGPRPEPAQDLMLKMKEQDLDFEEQKIQLQNWYNADKGRTLQEELIQLIQGI